MLATKLSGLSNGLFRADDQPVQWAVSRRPVAYEAAVRAMEAHASKVAANEASEMIWLLEHPPLYTAGVSSKAQDLLQPERFPVHASGRGGQYTYHGPGQRVAYVMLDLSARRRDVHAFVAVLEAWIVDALRRLGVSAGPRPGRVGVWVERSTSEGQLREDKIAALGVKIRRWASFHGVSLNVAPDLTHFAGIVPCGIRDHGVTSLQDLGLTATMQDADDALRQAFQALFGPTVDAEPPA